MENSRGGTKLGRLSPSMTIIQVKIYIFEVWFFVDMNISTWKLSHPLSSQFRCNDYLTEITEKGVNLITYVILLHFLCDKLMQNMGNIRNLGFIGGQAL